MKIALTKICRGFLLIIALANSIAVAQTVTRTERQLLGPFGAGGGSYFGWSVAMAGDTAIATAPWADFATVFVRDSTGVWNIEATLAGFDTAAGDYFGWSASVIGPTGGNAATIVIGAPDAGGKGAAYVFRKGGQLWIQIAKLTASDGAIDDRFGRSVSIHGDTVIVGAPFATIGGNSHQGAAYIFRETLGSGFDAGVKITSIGGGDSEGYFGLSVSTHGGNRAIVGAPFQSANQGRAHFFSNTNGTWNGVSVISSDDPQDLEYFGHAVALSHSDGFDLVWVGAPGMLASGVGTGSMYVFTTFKGVPPALGAQMSPENGVANEGFGSSLCASGLRCAVGSPNATVGISTTSAGCVRVCRFTLGSPGTLTQFGARFIRSAYYSSDNLGCSVAIDGDRLLAGIYGADITNTNRGAVASFSVNTTRGDINDNGKGDVVWFDPVGGNLCGWKMNGLTRETGAILSTGLGSGAEYCGLGDFYGDGKQCALVRLKSNGAFKISRLNGLYIASSSNISNGIAAEWHFLACADFNGDGKADVLLRNALTGQVNGWLMNGATKLSGGMIGAAHGLEFLGTGDCDGDGDDDILWRNQFDQPICWQMSGLNASGELLMGPAGTLEREWAVTAIGDLNADGTDDVVIRHVGSASITGTGKVLAWLVEDGQVVDVSVMNTGIPLSWRTEACADLDGDGDDDILWRNRDTGDVNAWLVQNALKQSGAFVKNVSLSWAILNADDYNDDHGYDGNGCDDDGDDLNRDDYADDHGGSNADDSNVDSGAVFGGYETVSVSACVNCVNAAVAALAKPVVEVSSKIEGGVAYVDVVQIIDGSGQFKYARYRANNASVVGSMTFTDTSDPLMDYVWMYRSIASVTTSPSAAITAASALHPGKSPHGLRLNFNGSFKWKVELVGSNGVIHEAVINAG